MSNIYQALSEGNPVYLIDLMDERVFHLIPNEDYCLTKYKGRDQYRIKRNSNIVLDAIHAGKIITKERYESF
ncbi:MAG: hypothetical protein WAZ98_03245 [Cyclobacteriaceae bacterium]